MGNNLPNVVMRKPEQQTKHYTDSNICWQYLVSGYCQKNFTVLNMSIPIEIQQLIVSFYDEIVDIIQIMKTGVIFLKHGKRGKPKYLLFYLTFQHKYLAWFDPSLSHDESRIHIKAIRRIEIGTESQIVKKTKNRNIIEASCTIVWIPNKEKSLENITLTAMHEKEMYVWCQGLKMLSDSMKRGRHLLTLPSDQICNSVFKEYGYYNCKEMVNIVQSCFKIFPNKKINKYHVYLTQKLQKLVNWVVDNYKNNSNIMYNVEQFDRMKSILENIDYKLRYCKNAMEYAADSGNVDNDKMLQIKRDLFLCNKDILALNDMSKAVTKD
eukprot:442835_1